MHISLIPQSMHFPLQLGTLDRWRRLKDGDPEVSLKATTPSPMPRVVPDGIPGRWAAVLMSSPVVGRNAWREGLGAGVGSVDGQVSPREGKRKHRLLDRSL